MNSDPNSMALHADGRYWTIGELTAVHREIAAILRSSGVRGGDRVMIIGENCVALVALLFAISSLDAWAVMVNARLSAREIDAVREHCGARRTIYLDADSPEAAAHADRHQAATLSLGAAGAARMSALNTSCEPEAVHANGDQQVAALIYTSGTTGNPKGVMLTHRNLLFIAAVSATLRRITSDDHVYAVLPISHVYGLASVCLGSLFGGACLHLEARYTPQKMARALRDEGITVCQGVPAMYARLLEMLKAGGQKLQPPALRFIYAGGSPLDPALKAEVEAHFGLTLNNGYGLTEASPTISQTRLDESRVDCSVGRAIPRVDVRVVDRAGSDVAEGETGELWVRGQNVMKGYYRNPAATAEAINADGWLNTGDLASRDASGALFIIGRTKDLIIRSGFNVYPVEVEAVLNAHPDVTQSAVVGREVAGNEEVVAFVERAPGKTISEAGLIEFAAALLAPYKRPMQIIFMSPLPAAANGKVLKHKLKEMLKTMALN
ncbi:MAG: AMP-binding protein [Betaproteobacteria bacterium]|nr:AMP-binding protein [Betaproteobacteria bacterium]